jgi:Micro-tubular organiser Mto1 C-term Mto2-binding region
VIPAYHTPDERESASSSSGGQDKWIHRLRELERRLKAERELRLLDRSGARKRLEERDAANEELKMELERERMRAESVSTAGHHHDEEAGEMEEIEGEEDAETVAGEEVEEEEEDGVDGAGDGREDY